MKQFYLQLICLLFLLADSAFSQQSTVPKNFNYNSPWTTDRGFSNLTITNADWGNSSQHSNILLSNDTKVASNSVTGGNIDSLRITDPVNIYKAGNFVGVKGYYAAGSLNINVEVSTWNGNEKLESKVFTSYLLGVAQELTFQTTKDYNNVQVHIHNGLGKFEIEHFLVKAYEAGPTLPCNTQTVITAPTYSFDIEESLTGAIGLSAMSNGYNLIDNDPSTKVSIATLIGGGGQVAVIDKVQIYEDPHYVGFDISKTSVLDVSALATMEIRTYLNGVLQETVPLNSAVIGASLIASNTTRMGFVTSKPFNTVQFYQAGVSINIGDFSVDQFIITKFCAGDDLVCNEFTQLRNPEHSVYINSTRSGIDAVACVNCELNEAVNILDADPNNYASMIMAVGAVGDISLSVKDAMKVYDANTYAGFEVVTASVLDLTVISGLTIETYLDNQLRETFTGSSLIGLGTGLLDGANTSKIGFLSSQSFDEIRLVIKGAVTANVGTTRVYNVFATKLCDINVLDCNTPSLLSFPEQPVIINSVNTGVTSVACVGCSIDNPSAVLDGDTTTTSALTFVANVLGTAQVAIKKAVTPFDAYTFVGLPLKTNSILDVDLITLVKLKAYHNNNLVYEASVSDNSIVSANVGLLYPTSYQVLGFVPPVPFDEVIIEFIAPVSANVGTIIMYDAIVQKYCNQPLECDKTIYWNEGSNGMPVYVNYDRTGSIGLACVACNVLDPQNVISSNTADFATIDLTASVVAGAAISIVDAMNEYPAGSYAGYTVKTSSGLAEVQLLSGFAIETYLNGVRQETSDEGYLLGLDLLGLPLFGTGNDIYNIAFKTTKPFNEIRLIAREIVGVGLLDDVRVYGAWVDTRDAVGGTLQCFKQVNPDMNVGIQNQTITGDVSTNDVVPNDAVYQNWKVADGDSTAINFQRNPDGSYSFVATEPGVYIIEYELCVNNNTECIPSFVQITVLPEDKNSAYPVVVNPDYANVKSGNTITIPVLDNDAAGHESLKIDTSTLRISDNPAEQPKNGTAVVNPDGTISYTPNPGFVGKDTLFYYVSDNGATRGEGSSLVVFEVLPTNGINTVVANNDYFTTSGPISGNVFENDTDADGDGIVLVSYGVADGNPNAPSLVIQNDGSFVFEPNSGETGTYQYVYTIADNSGSSSPSSATITIHVADAVTLPIIVEKFDLRQANGANILTWKTSLELNAAYFGIERSTDAINYTEIAQVKAEELVAYEYRDVNAPKGKLYYRLKLVDLDQSFKYSIVKMIDGLNIFKMNIYPNPTTNGKTYLSTGNYSGRLTVMVLTATGKKVNQIQLNVQSNGTVELPILPVQNGVYYMVVLDSKGSNLLQEKIIKQ